jgi:hypothetical protein
MNRPAHASADPEANPRHRQGGGGGKPRFGLCLPGQCVGASGGKPRLREHALSGVWGVAYPAVGVECDPIQVEG